MKISAEEETTLKCATTEEVLQEFLSRCSCAVVVALERDGSGRFKSLVGDLEAAYGMAGTMFECIKALNTNATVQAMMARQKQSGIVIPTVTAGKVVS